MLAASERFDELCQLANASVVVRITDVLVERRNFYVVMAVIMGRAVKIEINMQWKVTKTTNDQPILNTFEKTFCSL